MRIFNVGCDQRFIVKDIYDDGLAQRMSWLLSYVDLNQSGEFWNWFAALQPGERIRLMMDSGAFSIHTRGAQVDLGEYIKFLQENRELLFCYATLDVIGDHAATRKNYQRMRRAGLEPMAVFHHESPYDELKRYCKEGTAYLALGGLVPLSRTRDVLRRHLDKCWSIIREHWPIKVHAFGITTQWVLERYPWYSCDSMLYGAASGYGDIIEFKHRKIKRTHWKEAGRAGKHPGMVDDLRGDGNRNLQRRYYNLKQLLRFEEYLTQLWKERGIEWTE